jgi:hypothetical protein
VSWVRPGPPSILPRSAPGGVVVHGYDVPSQRLLFVQGIEPGANVDKAAGDNAGRSWPVAEEGVCLVAYDGDTGERMDWPQ